MEGAIDVAEVLKGLEDLDEARCSLLILILSANFLPLSNVIPQVG